MKDMEKDKKTELLKKIQERFQDIDKWRKEYGEGKLNVIEVEDKIAVLRPIGVKNLADYSLAVLDEDKGLDVACRYLLEQLWLGGDNEIRDDEEYFMSAMLQIQKVIEIKKSAFTKL